MGHRGTGRSTFFDCVAAQATTTGSSWGSEIEIQEIPVCAQALQNKHGDLVSFSVTSATTDMKALLSEHSNGASTIVYGTSYGTALSERLTHLNPPKVTGYVLDSIATSSGAPADKFGYYSTCDAGFGEVGNAFMALCAKDAGCNDRFSSNSLKDTLQDVVSQFDKDPNSMLHRCSSSDKEVLKFFLKAKNENAARTRQDSAFTSMLLQNLIIYSEMWESPQLSMKDMTTFHGCWHVRWKNVSQHRPILCLLERRFVDLQQTRRWQHGIIYERDQYWNKSATIPKQSNMLVLNSVLGRQTPPKHAKYLHESLKGDDKELIIFKYVTHGTLWSTPLVEGDTNSEMCGMKMLE